MVAMTANEKVLLKAGYSGFVRLAAKQVKMISEPLLIADSVAPLLAIQMLGAVFKIMKSKISIKKKVEPKSKTVKLMTYTYEPKGKLAKQVSELLQSNEDKKKKQHTDLREIAIYLSGILNGGGSICPIGTSQLESLWEVVLTLR